MEAVKLLKEIYLKQLFNLKCRWVAGEMDLPGIEISHDFNLYQDNPTACIFLEPITAEELDCYLDFLECEKQNLKHSINDVVYNDDANYDKDNEDDDEDKYLSSSILLLYHRSKANYNNDCHTLIPRWFHHYDKHFKTAYLLDLPTIRVDIELDYLNIWKQEFYYPTLSETDKKTWSNLTRMQHKELEENPEKGIAYSEERERIYAENKKDETQYVHISTYNKEDMKELMGLIETPEIRSYYNADRRWHYSKIGNERIQSEIYELQNVKERIPIESNDDYRISIKKTYDEYAHKMTMEALPIVFDQYKQCIVNNKPFNWFIRDRVIYTNDELKEQLIAVRKFKNEPENLDFLKKENLQF